VGDANEGTEEIYELAGVECAGSGRCGGESGGKEIRKIWERISVARDGGTETHQSHCCLGRRPVSV
jgi:hypothetical protein